MKYKIDFILCTNNQLYMDECRNYLEELCIPDGYEAGIIEIHNAASMAAGYNEGMRQSEAKYKVYLHQDVFITNKYFLQDILNIFRKDERIGMIGMVGTPYMVKNAVMWNGIRFGGFYRLKELIQKDVVHRFYPIEEGYLEVEAIDGLLMATQYDIPWREEIFKRWDFYDVSQSFEFRKSGYKVVIPGQQKEWYIHDCGAMNLEHYKGERERFLSCYSDIMKVREQESWTEYMQHVYEMIETGYVGTEKEQLCRWLKLAEER